MRRHMLVNFETVSISSSKSLWLADLFFIRTKKSSNLPIKGWTCSYYRDLNKCYKYLVARKNSFKGKLHCGNKFKSTFTIKVNSLSHISVSFPIIGTRWGYIKLWHFNKTEKKFKESICPWTIILKEQMFLKPNSFQLWHKHLYLYLNLALKFTYNLQPITFTHNVK